MPVKKIEDQWRSAVLDCVESIKVLKKEKRAINSASKFFQHQNTCLRLALAREAYIEAKTLFFQHQNACLRVALSRDSYNEAKTILSKGGKNV